MNITIPDRVVVFDYGEVISRSPSAEDRAALHTVAGGHVDFWASYASHRDVLDAGGMSVPDFWERIAADIGARWSAATIQALWVLDFRSWISVEPGTVDLVAALHAGGTRLAMLSNAGFDYAGPLRRSPIGELFERVFVSAEMASVKPAPAIYREVADELGITLDQMVFVDNRKENTDAAARLGATVHVFETVSGLDAFLRGLAI